METEGLVDFIVEAGKLKDLPRTGWVESGVPNPESVADHSFRVALIALILADAKGLNSIKAVRMALLHDLAEVKTGDLTPIQKRTDSNAAKRTEDEAMDKLFRMLPVEIQGIYRSAWQEFSEASTEEACLVRDVDKLEMVMQASEYQQAGVDSERLMRFWHADIIGEEAKVIRDVAKSRSIGMTR